MLIALFFTVVATAHRKRGLTIQRLERQLRARRRQQARLRAKWHEYLRRSFRPGMERIAVSQGGLSKHDNGWIRVNAIVPGGGTES